MFDFVRGGCWGNTAEGRGCCSLALRARWKGGASSGSVIVPCSLLASSLLAWPRDFAPPSSQAHHTLGPRASHHSGWLAVSQNSLHIPTTSLNPPSSQRDASHLLVLRGNASCLPSDWTVIVQATLTFFPGNSVLAIKMVSHVLLPAASREGSQCRVMSSDTEIWIQGSTFLGNFLGTFSPRVSFSYMNSFIVAPLLQWRILYIQFS